MNQPIAARGAEKQRSTLSSRTTHWFQHHKREARDSFSRLAQAPLSTLMTVLVMTIALTLPLALGKLLDDAQSAAAGWDGEARLSIYLNENVAAEDLAGVLARAKALPGITSARLISPEDALAEFKEQSGYGPALEQLGENPLPAVLEVFPAADASSSAMTRLRDQLAQWPEVALAEVDIAWVQRLQTILELGQRLLWAIGGALLLGGLLVVGNTIRLSIESRRDEIRVISLLGGTHGFVRRPFIYMGVWCGLSAGVFTLISVSSLTAWLNEPVTQMARLYSSSFALSYPSFTTGLAVLAGAGFLGWLGAWLAVGRHLRELES